MNPEAAKILRRVRRALDDLERAPVDLPDKLAVLRAAQSEVGMRITALVVVGGSVDDEFSRFEETRF